jgi:hypothetical protein
MEAIKMEKIFEKYKVYVNEDVAEGYYACHLEYLNPLGNKFLDIFLEVIGKTSGLYLYDGLNKEWQVFLDDGEEN